MEAARDDSDFGRQRKIENLQNEQAVLKAVACEISRRLRITSEGLRRASP